MQLEMRPPGHRCDLSGGLAQQEAMMQVLVAQSSTDVTLMGFSEIWLRVAGCEQYCPKKTGRQPEGSSESGIAEQHAA